MLVKKRKKRIQMKERMIITCGNITVMKKLCMMHLVEKWMLFGILIKNIIYETD